MAIHASRETEELGKRESPGGRAKAMADATDSTTEIQIRLDRLRAGDESACDELLEIARARLGRLARKMLQGYPGVRRWEQTDDIIQNVSLRLSRALKEVRPESVRSFICLGAVQIRRELIDLARHYEGPEGLGRHQISQAGPDDAGTQSGPPDSPADTDDPARLASWAEFHDTIEALPEAEREVFDLLWYQGLTQREAAALLGVTERVAKRRWRAARLTLHERLGGRMPG
jgi:RNA polymerase sigma factor (sigma-70 family)